MPHNLLFGSNKKCHNFQIPQPASGSGELPTQDWNWPQPQASTHHPAITWPPAPEDCPRRFAVCRSLSAPAKLSKIKTRLLDLLLSFLVWWPSPPCTPLPLKPESRLVWQWIRLAVFPNLAPHFSDILSEIFRQKRQLTNRLQHVLPTHLTSCRNPSVKSAGEHSCSLFSWLLWHPVGTLPTKVPSSPSDCSLFSWPLWHPCQTKSATIFKSRTQPWPWLPTQDWNWPQPQASTHHQAITWPPAPEDGPRRFAVCPSLSAPAQLSKIKTRLLDLLLSFLVWSPGPPCTTRPLKPESRLVWQWIRLAVFPNLAPHFSDILSEIFWQKCQLHNHTAACSSKSHDILSEPFRQKCRLRNLTAVLFHHFSDVLSELFRHKCHPSHQTAVCSRDFSDILSDCHLFLWLLRHPVGTLPTKVPQSQP